MRNLLPDYQMLIDYNYLIDNVIEEKERSNFIKEEHTQNADADSPIFKAKELLISIIDKSRRLIGEQDIERLCKTYEIDIKEDNNISIKNNIYETANGFIENLITMGGNIIKIMLHNLSHEIDLTILKPAFSMSNRSLFSC